MAVSRVVLGVLGVTAVAAAAAVATVAFNREAPDHYLGLRLGMTEAEALDHMNTIAPGALAGQQCRGGTGILSYIKQQGLDWQIMAHTREGAVDQIRLFRYERSGTPTTEQCLAHYRILLRQQRAAYPDASWHEATNPAEGFAVSAYAKATLPDDTIVEIAAERLDWGQARCAMELLFSQPGTRQIATR